jgi:hypothetical protein
MIKDYDKVLHFIVGGLVALSPVEPMIAVLVVAFGKEIYDYYSPKHTCDGSDALATLVGGLTILTFLGN